MSVVMNFWIAIPVDDFFWYSNDIMKKYGVSAYVEVIDNKSGNRNVYTYREDSPNVFTEYFVEQSYHSFHVIRLMMKKVLFRLAPFIHLK